MSSGQPVPFPTPEAERAAEPDFDRWRQMVAATGGCAQPIKLQGQSLTIDTATGEVVEVYDTAAEPTGYLLIPCGNRRASRCLTCADVYQKDAFHLILAGLGGGKGVSDTVASHPRIFATLTAPSFGFVHTSRETDGKLMRCRPRRKGGTCEHGRPVGCPDRHQKHDPRLGTPLCPDCYDYAAAILWNAHAGQLWKRFRTYIERALAASVGLSRNALRKQARLGYAKIAEYQARGVVHFHAVIRIDGPAGPNDAPPTWATVQLLETAIRSAARAVVICTPDPHDPGQVLPLRWGNQLDIQPVYVSSVADDNGLADVRVASYIAKYATKGAEAASTPDRPIRSASDIAMLNMPEHTRRMINECWNLGMRREYAHLGLRRWAHMLGYSGHFLTKSRRFSTTMTALRQARAEHRAAEVRKRRGEAEPIGANLVSEAQWRFAGKGHRRGEIVWAEAIRDRVRIARTIEEKHPAG